MSTTMAVQAAKREKHHSSFVVALKSMKQNKAAMVSVVVLGVLILLAVLAPVIAPYSYDEINVMNKFASPSSEHWFGTDQLGRDIFSRILYGARYSLGIGISVVIFQAIGGIIVGAIAGYLGGWVDNLLMRLMDILSSIPQMLLAIVLAAGFGTGTFNTILALSISGIPGIARLLRSSFLQVRKMEYAEAAECINCGNLTIMGRHLLPNCFAPLMVQCTMRMAGAILNASSLSFIGLGVQNPEPEWGAMISSGRDYLLQHPNLMLWPGLFIMITVLAINLIGDALRDALDPKLRK